MIGDCHFGNVWGEDIPVNKKNITPKWIAPIRFLIKVPFGLFGNYGKIFWKRIDKVVFNYWMVNTHTLKAFDYLRILTDFNKRPRGIYACWAADDYISKLKSKI